MPTQPLVALTPHPLRVGRGVSQTKGYTQCTHSHSSHSSCFTLSSTAAYGMLCSMAARRAAREMQFLEAASSSCGGGTRGEANMCEQSVVHSPFRQEAECSCSARPARPAGAGRPQHEVNVSNRGNKKECYWNS